MDIHWVDGLLYHGCRNPEKDTLLQRIASSGSVISLGKVPSSPSNKLPLEVLSTTKTVSTQVQAASLALIWLQHGRYLFWAIWCGGLYEKPPGTGRRVVALLPRLSRMASLGCDECLSWHLLNAQPATLETRALQLPARPLLFCLSL